MEADWRRRSRLRKTGWGLLLVMVLFPAPALAFGPAAHLEFSREILADLVWLAPALAAVLRRFADDFLYGAIAADITVAKNLTPYREHCHNWRVGFQILDAAEDDAGRAFAWGYLLHLAADVVAHNYFIPWKTVADFAHRGLPHVYWEVRFDHAMPTGRWEEARELARRGFPRHDALLSRMLSGTVLPFRINRRIFDGVFFLNRLSRLRRVREANARRSALALTTEEIADVKTLAVALMRDVLARGRESDCLQADPTGQRNLVLARSVRRGLRALSRESRMTNGDGIETRFRKLFRESIGQTVELPSLEEYTARGTTARQTRRTRARHFVRRLLGRRRPR